MSDGQELEYEDESDGQQQVPRETGSELPLKEGAVFGIIGVLVTYLSHLYLTVAAAAQTTPVTYSDGDTTVVTDLVSSWVAAGWSYLAAFGVGFEASGEVATLGDAPNNVAALSNSPFFLASTVLFTVTVGSLMAAGYGIARYTDADDPVEAVKAGLTVVPPYLVFAALAAVLMTHSYADQALVGQVIDNVGTLEAGQFINDEGSIVSNVEFGASTTDAILFAGIIFPAAFAVVGSLITQGEEVIDTAIATVNER